MNREESLRIGHLFTAENLNSSKTPAYPPHSNAIFLCHLSGHGDVYWHKHNDEHDMEEHNFVICRYNSKELQYWIFEVYPDSPGIHLRRKEIFPWYKTGLYLARKRQIYSGPCR